MSADNPSARTPTVALLGMLACALATSGTAQDTSPRKPVTGSAEAPILVGTVTRADLQRPLFAGWFDGAYSNYRPKEDDVDALRRSLDGVSIEAYFGTWCGDSRRQIPRLMRLLDMAGLDDSRLTLIGLSDRPMEFKQSPGHPEARRRVHRTPTIVLVRAGSEIGRIVETPATSLESDILAILSGRGPAPKYGAEAFVHQLFVDPPPEGIEKALLAGGPEVLKRSDPGSLWHYAEHDLLKNGRARDALLVLELHLSLQPRSVIGHILMSEALAALGRRAEAIEAVDRALEIDPRNDRALRAAARLRRPDTP